MYKFIGHENWNKPFPNILLDKLASFLLHDDTKVIILRGCMWFYKNQKTTLGEVRKHFTEQAIEQLIHDKFIETQK